MNVYEGILKEYEGVWSNVKGYVSIWRGMKEY